MIKNYFLLGSLLCSMGAFFSVYRMETYRMGSSHFRQGLSGTDYL